MSKKAQNEEQVEIQSEEIKIQNEEPIKIQSEEWENGWKEGHETGRKEALEELNKVPGKSNKMKIISHLPNIIIATIAVLAFLISLGVFDSPPPTPQNLTVTRTGDTTAHISWVKVSGAISYEAQFRSPNTNEDWRKDNDYFNYEETEYTVRNLGNYTYHFRVRSVSSTGLRSEWSEVIAYTHERYERPLIPQNLTAIRTGDRTAYISWDVVTDAVSYEAQFQSPNTNGEWRIDGDYNDNTTTSYISFNLGDYTYHFRVRSVSSEGRVSEWSEVLTYTHQRDY